MDASIGMPEKKAIRFAVLGHLIFLILFLGSWKFHREPPVLYTDTTPTIQAQAVTEEQLEELMPQREPVPEKIEPLVLKQPELDQHMDSTVPAAALALPVPVPPPIKVEPAPPAPKPPVVAPKEHKVVQNDRPVAAVKEEPKLKPDFSSAEEKKKKDLAHQKEQALAKEKEQKEKEQKAKEKALAKEREKEKEKEKAALLAKEKEHEKALAKEKQLALAKEKEQKEKQRKEALAKQAEALAQAKAAEEAKRAQAAARAAELAAEKDKLMASIQRKVRSQWINQWEYRPDLSATLKLHLDEKGEILNIDVVESSGDETFDRQAKLAAQRSAPFQLPEDPGLAREFKTLILPFQKS